MEEIILLSSLEFIKGSQYNIQKEGFDNFLKRLCINTAKRLGLKEGSVTVEYLKELFKKYFKDELSEKSGELYKYEISPLPDEQGSYSSLRNVSRAKSINRDYEVLEKIAKFLEKNDRLMIVYGGTHGVVLKPALEYLLHE